MANKSLLDELYDETLRLAEQGDDHFVQYSGEVLQRFWGTNEDRSNLLGELSEYLSPRKSGGYTRDYIRGENGNGQPVIIAMQWPEDLITPFHDHWDSAFMEVVLEGKLVTNNVTPRVLEGGDSELIQHGMPELLNCGNYAVLSPKTTQTHCVIAPCLATSLHIYLREGPTSVKYEPLPDGFDRNKFRRVES